MQSATIWFNKGLNPLSLTSLKVILWDDLCCTVEDTEWRLDSFVVPQLKVTAPAQFLLQIEDNPMCRRKQEKRQKSLDGGCRRSNVQLWPHAMRV